jgi:hypothetical protein
MPASDFTWYPTWVEPETVDFAVSITECENFKKDYQAVSDNRLKRFNLIFEGVLDSTRNSMAAHYTNSATGSLNFFEWTTVPSYLDSGTTMVVRYVKDSYDEKPRSRYWDIEMTFEESTEDSPGITFGEVGLYFGEEALEF